MADHLGRQGVITDRTGKAPLLVMTSAPLAGHFMPPLQVARELIQRKFEVAFLSAVEFKDDIERIGAKFYETTPFWPEGSLEEREKMPAGLPKLLFDMKVAFINAYKQRSADMRSLLEDVRQQDPERSVVIVAETMSMAVLPFMYGAPLPKGYTKFPKVININVIPLAVGSIDTAPFGFGLPPDSTASGRARNKVLDDLLKAGPFAEVYAYHDEFLKSLGCSYEHPGTPFNAWLDSYDTTLQMCSPSLEYPRSDLHPSIRFAGLLPKRGLSPTLVYPSWWSQVVSNTALSANSPEKKKLIAVAQGTLAIDYRELIIPAIQAFAERKDTIVIAMLGVKGAKLPDGVSIPENAHVIDYLPYDAALEHADLFITNGGYGSMAHGVNNAVPMVVAGITEDKTEVTARAEWAGLAINLKTQTPSPKQVSDAADTIFSNPAFAQRALRLQKENSDLDSFSIIEKEIWKYSS